MAIEIVDFPSNSMVDLSILCQRLPEGNHKVSLRCSILLSVGPSNPSDFLSPRAMLAMAAELVRQPLPTMASLPVFFFSGVALPGGKVLVNWAGTTKQLEFYVIRHEFSE